MEDKSLYKLLLHLRDAEDGLIFSTDEEMKEALGSVKGKVDSIKYALAHLEAQKEKVAGFIKTHQAHKKSIVGQIERLNAYCVYCLSEMETDELYGEEWDIKLSENRPSVEIVGKEKPDEDDMFKFHDVIRTKHEWDKDLMKKKLEADPEALKDLAKLRRTKKVSFTSH